MDSRDYSDTLKMSMIQVPVERSQDYTPRTMHIHYAISDSKSTHHAEMISIASQENAIQIHHSAVNGLEEKYDNNTKSTQIATLKV